MCLFLKEWNGKVVSILGGGSLSGLLGHRGGLGVEASLSSARQQHPCLWAAQVQVFENQNQRSIATSVPEPLHLPGRRSQPAGELGGEEGVGKDSLGGRGGKTRAGSSDLRSGPGPLHPPLQIQAGLLHPRREVHRGQGPKKSRLVFSSPSPLPKKGQQGRVIS